MHHNTEDHTQFLVGQFSDSFKPLMDGVGICVENYARWIHEDHGEAYVFVPGIGRCSDSDPFPVIRMPATSLRFLKPYVVGIPWLSPRIARMLRTLPFDILHSHTPFVGGRMARRVARRRAIPHVTTFHTKYRDDIVRFVGERKLADQIVGGIMRFYESASAVTVPNRATGSTLKAYGYPGEPHVIPNGTDLDAVPADQRAAYAQLAAATFGLPTDRFIFLFVGQLRFEKNVHLIIESLGRLKAQLQSANGQGATFSAVFVGEGSDAQRMRRNAELAGISQESVFLGKVVDREQIQSIYALADLFLFPSVYDNAPLVIQEAAALAVPSVVAEGSNAAEGIRDGENGFVTAADPSAMTRLLKRLIASPESLRPVGIEAQRTLHRPWRDVVRMGVDLYREVIAESEAAAPRRHVAGPIK